MLEGRKRSLMRLFFIHLFCVFVLVFGCAKTEKDIAQDIPDSLKVSDHEFRRLVKRAKDIDAEQVVRAKRTVNPRVLRKLAKDEDESVRFYVASNRHTPYETLSDLAVDDSPSVRWAVAVNDSIPWEVMPLLAEDTDVVVRMGLAANLYTSSDILAGMIKDILPVLRRAALNPNMNPAILENLAESHDMQVRRAISRNLSTPPAALEKLALDPRRIGSYRGCKERPNFGGGLDHPGHRYHQRCPGKSCRKS